jgi:hypothetical protein
VSRSCGRRAGPAHVGDTSHVLCQSQRRHAASRRQIRTVPSRARFSRKRVGEQSPIVGALCQRVRLPRQGLG